ncbi:hypothetical protein PLICRDRAFT_54061 [Plicaturopsis crispa FD-325 SS-3]|nr:hypothetical protein PLICRDRAFT_54061 [Plicaturopsis crispa FD-325 SS-3]
MSLGMDLFGLIAGALSLLALFHSVVISQLPKTKIKDLDAVIRETEDQFYRDIEDGFLSNKNFVFQVEEQLCSYHLDCEKLRIRVLGAKSFLAEFWELLKGLSVSISTLCSEVSELQSEIITTSQEARMEMARTRRLRNPFARRVARIRPELKDSQVAVLHSGNTPRASLFNVNASVGPFTNNSRRGSREIPIRHSKSCPPAELDDVAYNPSSSLASQYGDSQLSKAGVSQLDIVLPVFRRSRPSHRNAPKTGNPVLYGPLTRPDATTSPRNSFAESNVLERGEMHSKA